MVVDSLYLQKSKSSFKKMSYHRLTVFLSILLLISMISPLTSSAQGTESWSSTLTFTEPGGAFDTAIFSEAPDANDGPPHDQYDIPKPIPPMAPYIRAWFNDGLTQPYHLLWKDCRQYPDISKTWNLTIQWAPQDFVSPTTITISWNPSILVATEYNTIDLYHDGSLAADMLTQGSYSFTAPAYTPTTFIISYDTIGNQPPFAINDATSTLENVPIDINVSNNDYDLDGELDLNSIAITLPPTHGTSFIQPNTGIVTYTPSSGYNGQDFFRYIINDTQGATSNQALVNITIIHQNQPPIVSDIPNQTILEGEIFTQISLDDYVTDLEDPDTAIQWIATGNTDLSINIFNRIATIAAPDAEWNGIETISFTAEDTGGLTDQKSATFTISPVNDPPEINDIPNQNIPEDTSFAPILLDTYVTDIDNSDNQMNWTFTGSTELIVSIDTNRIATISIPQPDWNGAETIIFTVEDPMGLSDSDSATFTVIPGNDPPIVSNIPDQTILEGTQFNPIMLDDYVEDPEDIDENITWTVTGHTDLQITINSNRIATIIVPNTDWYGLETITFTATDTALLSDSDIVTFEVISQNDPPITTNDFFNVNENSSNNILTILENDYDVDGDPIQINTITNPLHGNATHNGQTITYTPTEGYAGTDTLDYTIIDNNGSQPIIGNIEIIIQTNTPPNIPTTPSGPISGYTGTTYTFTTITTDPENHDIRYGWDTNNDSIVDQWIGPESSGDTNTITQSWDTIGTYTLKVKAQDTLGKESSWSNTHYITIKKKTSSGGGGGSPGPTPNILPTADASATTITQAYTDNDILLNGSKSTDIDGYITTWEWDLGDGTITTGETITHQYNQEGTYTIVLTVIDNNDGIDSDQITIKITQPNQPPQNLKITGPTTLKKHQPYSFTIIAHDPENNQISYFIDWGDTTNTTLPYHKSDIPQTLNHTWKTIGAYTITITAQDNSATETNTSTPLLHTVYVDIWQITGAIQGYLIDTNSDGIYDQFHNNELQTDTKIALQPNGTYLIDADGNNTWDYLYNIETNTLQAYIVSAQIEAFPLMIISIFAFVLLFLTIFIIKSIKQKNKITYKKERNMQNKKPPIK